MNKRKNIIGFLFIMGAVAAINITLSRFIWRIDLTEDNRYSLSESTKELLDSLSDKVYVKVYLHGNIGAEYKQLEKAVRETLEEFQIYAFADLQYDFIDPNQIEVDSLRIKKYSELTQRGLKTKVEREVIDGKKVEKIIFPGCVVSLGARSLPINFVKDDVNGRENFSRSISELEYEFASTLKILNQERKKRIAFIDGHGELTNKEIYDLMLHLSKFYDSGRLNLATVDTIPEIEAIVIAQPKTAYSEADKYKIDQFVMKGGRAIFAIDAIEIKTDSSGIVGLPYELNLRDLLFRYGVRMNDDMIQDLNSAQIPVRTGPNPNDIELKPWTFHPIINNYANHIITKNLDAVLMKNIGTLDTTKTKDVTKTPLLFTSKYTRVKGNPVGYSPDELRLNTDENYYPQQLLPVAYLLEGNFESLYKGRPTPTGAVRGHFKAEATDGKVVVISDADLLINEFDSRANIPYPLGYSKFTGQQFSNKNFLANTFDYLLNDGNVVNIRAKELSYRPLDLFKIDENKEKLYWQILNIVTPLALLILFGVVQLLLRKRKFEKF